MHIPDIYLDKSIELDKASRQYLFNNYINKGCVDSRELLILGNKPLVLKCLHKYRHYRNIALELFQIGCIGLIKAVDRFDPALNNNFSTYAIPTIHGEIKRYVRDQHIGLSRTDVNKRNKFLMFQNQHSDKSDNEIADMVGTSLAEIRSIMDFDNKMSLNYEMTVGDLGTEELQYFVSDNKLADIQDLISDRVTIKDNIRKLSLNERITLTKYCIEGLTQMEVADIVGVSQAQVYRYLNKLHTKLNDPTTKTQQPDYSNLGKALTILLIKDGHHFESKALCEQQAKVLDLYYNKDYDLDQIAEELHTTNIHVYLLKENGFDILAKNLKEKLPN